MAEVMSQKQFNYLLKDMPVVQQALKAQAHEIGAKAEALLVAHKHDGNAEITITHGDVDWYVNLQDKPGKGDSNVAPFAIEYGHWNALTGRWTEGIYVITRAAGLA